MQGFSDTAAGTSAAVAYVRGEGEAHFVVESAVELLDQAVATTPDRLALIVPASGGALRERHWTYRQLRVEAQQTARALLADFSPGDPVATWATGSPESILLQLGAAMAGIVLVTLNPANRVSELEFMLDSSGARGLFMDRQYRSMNNVEVIECVQPRLPALRKVVFMDQWQSFRATARDVELPAVDPTAPALILFTSGSTGQPKAAVLHHAGLVNNAVQTARHLGISHGSTWLNVLPMFHIGGSGTMTLGCLGTLGTQVLLPEFTPEAMLVAMDRYRVSVTMAVPTMLVKILECPNLTRSDLSSLELIVAGGSSVAPDLVHRVREAMGAEVATLMGQTEAGGAMFSTRRGDSLERVTQSVGSALALSEARIASTTDNTTLHRRQIGEICVRSPCVMREYLGMPEKTRATLDAQGWLHTGDLGYMREDGYVQITGRLKEMIIRGGENIYPREIEDLLVTHPDVEAAAVFGVADMKWGEQVAAAVVPRAGRAPDFEGLAHYLRERIAHHKVPRIWRLVAQFPLNASGKVQKFKLQEQFAREGATDDR